jgi:hypothetical protein
MKGAWYPLPDVPTWAAGITLTTATSSSTTQEIPMRTIEATTTINAPLADVWRVLIAGEEYAAWNPFIRVVSGDLAAGSPHAADHAARQPGVHVPSPHHPGVP